LDREFPTEPEAILESLKTGKTYFVISEWKGAADLSKKMPLIRKEVVTSRRQTAD
jgi:guanylate kinase